MYKSNVQYKMAYLNLFWFMHSEAKWKQNKDECGTFLRFSRFCLLPVLAHETEEVFLFLFPSQQLLPSHSFQSELNVFSEGRDMIHQCMGTDCNNKLFTSRANWDRTWHFLRTGDQKQIHKHNLISFCQISIVIA